MWYAQICKIKQPQKPKIWRIKKIIPNPIQCRIGLFDQNGYVYTIQTIGFVVAK